MATASDYLEATTKMKRRTSWTFAMPKGFGLAAVPLSYLLFFFVLPVVILFITSFFMARSFVIEPVWNVQNYARIFEARGFWQATWVGLKNGFFTAFFSVILSFPVAYYLVYRARTNIILYLVLLSWFSSYLVRVYAWRTILGTNGVINSFLMGTGIVSKPVEIILFSPFATVITLIHIMLPFALLILVSSMRDVRKEYLEAARDLGASGLTVLYKVILPMTYKGIVGSFMFSFILAAGDYFTPQLLGGREGVTSGLLIADQFRSSGNWPLGSAMAFVMMATFFVVYILVVAILRFARLAPGRRYHG
ncbi:MULTISPECIES: ABC transporter permease [unclassified Mesorhizobium]|uniref:ABC transporter permease n=1 Tax=unclassified Mesorhizobium TaxID=325217 RepID=UPI0024152B82|nr:MULTISPECIES: ABC transporter permease [unclassified Mesorhizobium]MDG4890112.1 ABC transporter permease [Mesorhizobium sp. WSM4887]MDG4904254.1 ABC transporter permease [Mesorhizobium sp. WSM4962]MDG4909281.1 ABC transporter permease [Mesorhizobium sp. WSM4898]MDG4921905.1 ABC transporter permease [Mesorhizobium sp. WSM4989]